MKGFIYGRGLWPMLLSLAVVASVTACQPPEEEGAGDKAAEAAPTEKIARVETVKLSTVDFTDYMLLTGETMAAESVTVSAELPGRVVAEDFEEGDEVKKGEKLVRIDVSVDRTRTGQINMALTQARRDLKRTEGLVSKGLATPADLERAQLQVKNNEYNLRLARQGMGKSTVSTPIAGVIDRKHLSKGEYANPGVPVATVVQIDTLKIEAGLPESQLRYAKEGDKVQVTVPALGLTREGVIKRIAVQANPKNRTFPLEVEIDNKDRRLRAGMRAELRMAARHFKGSVLMPRDALVELLTGRYVYVLNGEKVVRKSVELGVDQGRFVQVNKGLSAGDEVIVVGQRSLSDGDAVKVMKQSPCCTLSKTVAGGNP